MSIVLASASETTQKNAVADWVKVFPKQAVETYTGSVNFMKQLTVVAASTITYIRNMFPGENYRMETFGGLKLMILKKNCEDEIAQFVSTALLQASDAFEKKYEQTMRMMRSLMLTLETCVNTPLSSSWTDISIRLYYNDDAPVGYQAPGFLSPLEPRDHLAATSSGVTHNLGTVQTQYHKLTAAIYTKDLLDSNHDNPTQNTSELMENEMDFDVVNARAHAPPTATPAARVPTVLRCPCNMDDVDGAGDVTSDILICKYCGCGGHSVCYGVRGGGGARAHHCCDRCADAGVARTPTDTMLREVRPNQRPSLCIYRRTLWECSARGEVSAAALAHRFRLSQPNACKIIKLLRSSGVLVTGEQDDLISPRRVIREKLQLEMDKYFQKETIVEQLCADTITQDDEVDPFEDIEKSLKSATTLGQIIKPTPPKEIDENVTLQQYREAIIANEKAEEELPLSGDHNPIKDMDKIGKKTTKRKIDDDKKPRTAVKTKKK